LPLRPCFARARPPSPERAMSAIAVIVIFLVVIFALNKVEFGRLD
jgi:hypothetical protein